MKIIYYEGLFGVMFSWLKKGLIRHIKAAHPNIVIERRHWSNRQPIHDAKAIVIGHSFGGHAAWLNSSYCAMVVTIDPRWWINKFYKKKVLGVHHNYYQPNGLKGFYVHGATNHFYLDSSHLKLVHVEHILETINNYLWEG